MGKVFLVSLNKMLVIVLTNNFYSWNGPGS